jgi:putative peptidoglycan lipid II flippase
MLMPQAAIAQSIATAAMPTLAAQYARGQLKEVRESLARILRSILLLAIPASAGLIILRVPVIQLLFQRGEFSARSTELVAWALLWYAAGLVGHSVLEVLARAFYALHDTKTPVFVGVAAMSLNVIFSFLFSDLFRRVGWMPHGGLALANSLATALEMAVLLVLMRKRLDGIGGERLLKGFQSAALGVACMSLTLWVWMVVMGGSAAWLVAAGGVIAGGIVYSVVLVLLRVPEMKQLIKLLKIQLGSRIK